MKKVFGYIGLLLLGLLITSQETSAQERQILLSGVVLDSETLDPLGNINVIVKRTRKGTTTANDGTFYIEVSNLDTIIIGSVNYAADTLTLNWITSRKHNTQVLLEPRIYALDEVEVEGIGNYDRLKQKIIEMDERMKRPEKPFVEEPPEYSTERPKTVPPTLASPFDYLYEMFGNKPRQLRELARLEEQDAYEEALKLRFRPEIVAQLTGLSGFELERFMGLCRFSANFVFNASDYEFYAAILDYYRQYEYDFNER